MKKLKPTNYITSIAWMNDIGVSSLEERDAYALVYGFSQDNETEFQASLDYIAEWLMCSKRTAIKVMNSLDEKGLVEKRKTTISGVTFNKYVAIVPANISLGVKEFHMGSENSSQGSENSSPNNNIDNNIINNIDSTRNIRNINNITPTIKKEVRKKTGLSFEFLNEAENVKYASAMELWYDYKRKIHDMYKTQIGVETALADLKKICTSDNLNPTDVITYCIGKEWKGIYKPKDLKENGNSTSEKRMSLGQALGEMLRNGGCPMPHNQ